MSLFSLHLQLFLRPERGKKFRHTIILSSHIRQIGFINILFPHEIAHPKLFPESISKLSTYYDFLQTVLGFIVNWISSSMNTHHKLWLRSHSPNILWSTHFLAWSEPGPIKFVFITNTHRYSVVIGEQTWCRLCERYFMPWKNYEPVWPILVLLAWSRLEEEERRVKSFPRLNGTQHTIVSRQTESMMCGYIVFHCRYLFVCVLNIEPPSGLGGIYW